MQSRNGEGTPVAEPEVMVTAGKIKAVRKETRAGTLLQRKIFYGNAQALYPKMPALRAR